MMNTWNLLFYEQGPGEEKEEKRERETGEWKEPLMPLPGHVHVSGQLLQYLIW